MAPICENQMQINDTLYWNSNTMSFPESGLRTQYKTLATKKLGRNQTLPLPNMKLEKVHKSGKNLANWRYSHSHEMNCPVGNLQNISKAQVRKRIIAANSWRSSEGAEWGQESKALKKKNAKKLQSSKLTYEKRLESSCDVEEHQRLEGTFMAPGVTEGCTFHPHRSSINSLWNRQTSGYFVECRRLSIHSDGKLLRSDWGLANGEGWMCFNCTWFHPNRIQYLSSILTNVFSSPLFREYWFSEQGEPNR